MYIGRRDSWQVRIDSKAGLVGLLAAVLLIGLIVLGSGNLRHFDWTLLPYAVVSVCSVTTIAYRYTVWLQRPPTKRYWQQGWHLFWHGGPIRSCVYLGRLLLDHFAAQRFIAQRSHKRWITHLSLSWGGMLAFAITFPLVFGWIHFATPAAELHTYQVFVFGIPIQRFSVDSLLAFLFFNALNLSAILVLVGTGLALHHRLTDPGARALQQFGHDIFPLLLLLLVAATGLGLTVSARWLRGYGFAFVAFTHVAAVSALLLYLPFGKLFHIFQRSAHLGVTFYKRAAQTGPQARCRCCGEAFASQMQINDLKQVLSEVGFDYRLHGAVPHYQDICPPCRRKLLALNQARLFREGWNSSRKEWENRRNGETEKEEGRESHAQNLADSPILRFSDSDSNIPTSLTQG